METEKKSSFLETLNGVKGVDKVAKGNFLIAGVFKSGKTSSLETIPLPAVVCNFDPGGLTVLSEKFKTNQDVLILDYSKDDSDKPVAFDNFVKDFNRLRAHKYFNDSRSFALDSTTGLLRAVRTWVVDEMINKYKSKRTPSEAKYKVSTLRDWSMITEVAIRTINLITSLPCNVFLTAHTSVKEVSDDINKTNELIKRLKASPAVADEIPFGFDELYIARVKKTSKGPEHFFVTRCDRDFDFCGSRFAKHSDLPEEVPQDWEIIFKHIGLSWSKNETL